MNDKPTGRYLPPHPDDASIPMDEAIRAYRDRPSMEKELEELRETVELIGVTNRSLGEAYQEQEKEIQELRELAAIMAAGLLAENAIEAGECTHCGDLKEKAVEVADKVSGICHTEYDAAIRASLDRDQLRDQLASYDNRYAAMAETIERTKMELIQTEQARDRLRGALGKIVDEISGDRRYGRCIYCGNGANIARAALGKKEFDAELEYKNAPDMPITEEEREAIVKRVIAETVLSKKEE